MTKSKRKKTTLEKLASYHFKEFGPSAEQSFFDWLNSMGVSANEEELKQLLKDCND